VRFCTLVSAGFV